MNRNSTGFKAAVALEHKVLDVAFLLLLLLFGWLAYAGMRGVIVGAVRGRQVTPAGTRLTLGIFPRELAGVPANVSARILPRTLFGEKYVALQVPDSPAGESIAAGDVIEQTDVAVVGSIPRQAEAFRGLTLHINLETLPAQPRGYGPQDQQVHGEDRGPIALGDCRDAVDGRYNQADLSPRHLFPDLDDGVEQPTGKGGSANRATPGAALDVSPGYAGSRAEQQVVSGLADPVLGVPADEVPDVGTLLFGPLARGTEVTPR